MPLVVDPARLKRARLDRPVQISVRELARRAKVTPALIYGLEAGPEKYPHIPREDTLNRIAKVLGLTAQDLADWHE